MVNEIQDDGKKKATPPTDQAETTESTDTGNDLFNLIMRDELKIAPAKTEGTETTPKTDVPAAETKVEPPKTDSTTTAETKDATPAAPGSTTDTTSTPTPETTTGPDGQPLLKTGTEENILLADPTEPPKTSDAVVPPATSDAVVPPSDAAVPPATTDATTRPVDVLEGVVDKTLRELVNAKSDKMITHIENGAAFLKQGMAAEATSAYREAADLVSPEEQKFFLEQEKKLQQLIKDETAKPSEQQDAKKLEALKELERQTRTLGRVDMFTEVNSGLIWTQAGDITKASECFARAFLNEKSMIEAKALPAEGYLSKDPNLTARVNEISNRLAVNVWKVMGDSVQRAGVDPKLVGLDTGRGPPVRTEGGSEPAPIVAVKPEGPDTPADVPQPDTNGARERNDAAEKALEEPKPIVFSPKENGKSPLERVGQWIDKVLETKQLTPEIRAEIERAIADADKGMSPVLEDRRRQQIELDKKVTESFKQKLPNSDETVFQAKERIDESLVGTYEVKVDPADANKQTVSQTKEGLIDKFKFVPNARFTPSEESQTANPPADYKASAPKPADFKGTDEEWRVQAFRNDARDLEFRDFVKTRVLELDSSINDEQYAERLKQLRELQPDNKAFQDALTERDSVMANVRKDLIPLNMVTGNIPAELNQSATTRSMYAELLELVDDKEGEKKYRTEAYAWNQIPEQIDGFRALAMNAGVDPFTLFDAAVNQSEARGPGSFQKALRPDALLVEANLLFVNTDPTKKAEVTARLKPAMEQIQRLTDAEYAQVKARSNTLLANYEKTLPADKAAQDELSALRTRMVAAEESFTPEDAQNALDSKDPAVSETRRKEAEAAIAKSQPAWFADSQKYTTLLGDNGPAHFEANAALAVHYQETAQTGKNVFYSRALLAMFQKESGDSAGAQASLTDGFQRLPKSARESLLDKDPIVKHVVQKVGLDVNAIKALPETATTDATASVTVPKSAADTTAVPATDAQPAPGTDAQPALEVELPKSDPRFADMTNEQLVEAIKTLDKDMTRAIEVQDMYKELIVRADSKLMPQFYDEAALSMNLVSEALDKGREITTDADGKLVLSDQPLSDTRRTELHVLMFREMSNISEQAQIRLEYAQYLKASHQFAKAEQMGIEARDRAEELTKERKNGDKTFRIVDLMKQEAGKLLADLDSVSDPELRKGFQGARQILNGADADTGAIKLPINANKFLVQLYMGTEVVPQLNSDGQIVGLKEMKFGQGPAFKPDKAIDPAFRALQHTRHLIDLDPQNKQLAEEIDGITSVFGVLGTVVENPGQYNMSVAKGGEAFTDADGKPITLKAGELYGRNHGNIPIVIESHTLETLKAQVKKGHAMDSMLLDAGIALGMGVAVAATRNPKLAQFVERSMGAYGAHAGKVLSVARYAAIPALGLAGRNAGYKLMTGTSETWTDSAVHLGGSLLAAELGGRVSGRGSFLSAAKGPGPRQFAKMDAEASAKYVTREGYETSGQFHDLLKSQGYVAEAAAFNSIPRGTRLINEAGKLEPQIAAAFEKANISGARTGAIAEVIAKNPNLARAKHDVLAARIAKADAGGLQTVDDLVNMVQADQRMVRELSTVTNGLDDSVKLTDALAGKPNSEALLATAERYGLKNVKQAQHFAAEVEKIGFDKVFPKLDALRNAGAIDGSTKLTDAVMMGTNVLEGPGLQRLLSLVPPSEHAGMLTARGLKEAMTADVVTGSRTAVQKLRDGVVGTKNAGVTTWNAVFTKQGRANLGAAVSERVAPLKSAEFWTSTVPGAGIDAAKWTGGKVAAGGRFVSDRFRISAIDPATATTEQLMRARFANGFYGGFAAIGTYNTIVKPYDMTGQIFGVEIPQLGGEKHPVAVDARGENMTWLSALKESHLPIVEGTENWPVYFQVLGSSAFGTPGQALFGAALIQPGAIYKPVWSNPQIGNFRKTMQSAFPLAPTRWNNWNAGLFNSKAAQAASMVAVPGIMSSVDKLGDRLEVSRYSEMLRNAQRPIADEPLPEQKGSALLPKSGDPKPDVKPGNQGGDNPNEPPPPGQ